MDDPARSRRAWLVLIVVAMAALGAWYSYIGFSDLQRAIAGKVPGAKDK